jgi:hypothetical protein
MLFEEKENKLVITLNDDERLELSEDYTNEEMQTDKAMFEFFETELANSHWEWIDPCEIGALTDAPILGYRGGNDEVVEAYGYMDYAVKSMLIELNTYGEVELQRG